VTAADVVDHVKPHKRDAAKFWHAELGRPSSKWHHDVMKQILGV
jgi:5-methylcytosine-specific restriction enzyme A